MRYTVISADSHVVEHRDLFLDRLPRHLRDKAPRVVRGEDGGDGWSYGGDQPRKSFAFALTAVAGKDLATFKERGMRWEEIPPGAYDGDAALADMDLDGVDASVLYPMATLEAYAMDDRELGVACIRAYNDWLLDDYCVDPKRLVGLCMLPVDDGMDVALGELERVLAKGARGCFLPGLPKCPYQDEYYDPLWSAASRARLPLSIHRNHGGVAPLADQQDHWSAGVVVRFFSSIRPLSNLVFAGVFDRNPDLVLVAAETNFGWVPFWIQMMDQEFETYAEWEGLDLKGMPHDLLGTSILSTVLDDYVGFDAIKRDPVLEDAAMYSTDYPHSVSLWPRSSEVIPELTKGMEEKAKHKVLAGNAVRIYRLDD